MGLFKKLGGLLSSNRCKNCKAEYTLTRSQLFSIPQYVGRFIPYPEAEYYVRNMRRVESKADLPIGQYACRALVYRCPECGHKLVKLQVFLPVRDEESLQLMMTFQNGELDDVLNSSYQTR